MPSSHLTARMASRLTELEQRAQNRELSLVEGMDLCSNDYLGLAHHPHLKQALTEAVANSARLASTGSRLVSGHHALWDELEAEFAAFAGTEAALYFSSGFAAN